MITSYNVIFKVDFDIHYHLVIYLVEIKLVYK
jgi:hypothetical protein